MITCVVRGCKSNSVKNSNLHFFSIPKSLKADWSDALSLHKRHITESTRVCELHFREKDFCATTIPGRKVLKHHAIPVLTLGKSAARMNNSDEEFMLRGSDSDPEIVEVKEMSKQELKSSASTTKPDKVDQDPPVQETGRRPSRRAAQLAVKKIQNTVRSFSLSADSISDGSDDSISKIKESPPKPSPRPAQQRTRKPAVTPKPIIQPVIIAPKPEPAAVAAAAPKKKFRDQKTWHAIRAPLADVGLLMECHEELLSAKQEEKLVNINTEYNNFLQKLKDIKSSNVRIIECKPPERKLEYSDDSDTESPQASPSPSPTKTVIKACPAPGTFTVKPANLVQTTSSGGVTVVPIHLVTVQPPVNIASSLHTLRA